MRDLYRDQRPFEARLSGFAYARLNETRGENPTGADFQVKRDHAERVLLDADARHASSESKHALGEFYLAERQFDSAIPYLEAAVKMSDSNPKFHSDLGAALLEKGRLEKQRRAEFEFSNEPSPTVEILSRSLSELDRALSLDSDLLDALFNRALCHEELAQFKQAEQDWRSYLDRDRRSGWSVEAQQHLDSIRERGR